MCVSIRTLLLTSTVHARSATGKQFSAQLRTATKSVTTATLTILSAKTDPLPFGIEERATAAVSNLVKLLMRSSPRVEELLAALKAIEKARDEFFASIQVLLDTNLGAKAGQKEEAGRRVCTQLGELSQLMDFLKSDVSDPAEYSNHQLGDSIFARVKKFIQRLGDFLRLAPPTPFTNRVVHMSERIVNKVHAVVSFVVTLLTEEFAKLRPTASARSLASSGGSSRGSAVSRMVALITSTEGAIDELLQYIRCATSGSFKHFDDAIARLRLCKAAVHSPPEDRPTASYHNDARSVKTLLSSLKLSATSLSQAIGDLVTESATLEAGNASRTISFLADRVVRLLRNLATTSQIPSAGEEITAAGHETIEGLLFLIQTVQATVNMETGANESPEDLKQLQQHYGGEDGSTDGALKVCLISISSLSRALKRGDAVEVVVDGTLKGLKSWSVREDPSAVSTSDSFMSLHRRAVDYCQQLTGAMTELLLDDFANAVVILPEIAKITCGCLGREVLAGYLQSEQLSSRKKRDLEDTWESLRSSVCGLIRTAREVDADPTVRSTATDLAPATSPRETMGASNRGSKLRGRMGSSRSMLHLRPTVRTSGRGSHIQAQWAAASTNRRSMRVLSMFGSAGGHGALRDSANTVATAIENLLQWSRSISSDAFTANQTIRKSMITILKSVISVRESSYLGGII